MQDDAKVLGEERIREKIADYRQCADIARRQAEQTHIPEIQESYSGMIEGFEKLALELEQALKGQGASRPGS